ncbi:autotransporter-associated beta strand protein [Pseudoduganella lurida]|uniref:Autotransporter-associated beta strand protein n=1 Tax=Pseudoduganella lurida TaxID=1036180 RepID=A0A562R8N9_9BURK|nr:phosphatase PAP2 family protein [Pseudoduganella lurida]TWI65415.1 autotransporter-associated beta strand protein [Pseudoduganella lurida]
MHHASQLRRLPLAIAIGAMLALAACGGSDHDNDDVAVVIPAAPADQGAADTAPVPTATAFVDTAATNQRGDARYATLTTNAGVRVLGGMLAIWKPLTELVDADSPAPAVDGFPAVVKSAWTGVPNDGTPGGTIVNAAVHNANIDYVVKATASRTAEQAQLAYLDDRRSKGYSVTEGMGPLTSAWRAASRATTTINDVPANATTVKYDDAGNNNGVGGDANADFGKVVDLVNSMGNNGSTEPAKRFYKYARPFRWSTAVKVVPQLEPAKSTTPGTDGGFTSGHSAEATRNAVAMAYVLPERYQELVGRGLELGESRILAGMHSPLDVISGRVQAQAVAAANLLAASTATRAAAVTQAHTTLMKLTNTTTATFPAFAVSGTPANDRFADYATSKANYIRRMTYGLPQIAAANAPAVVPKDAEVLLETRLPYLSDAQRRVVLKTTAIASGYPVLDDAEGWGRLNLFAAAEGYGVFTGNVVLNMDATKGGFSAADRWRNDITGTGKLVKQGTGALKLGGKNGWTGGTQVEGGTLEALSATAFGTGDVYVTAAGTVISNAPAALAIGGKYTQLLGGTLELRLGATEQGRLTVAGAATVGGGTLRIKFQDGYKPAAGTTLTVISAASFKGRFDTITVDGHTVTPTYTSTGLQLRLGA